MKNKGKLTINNTAFIIALFAILSVMSSFILLQSNFVGNSVDIVFHWSRIYEIRNSILNGRGLFPIVALSKFKASGSAIMTMYPYINLFPVVLLSLLIKSFTHLVYITFILRNFLSLIIAYFACYSFNKNRLISFIFSISYVLSTMTLFYSFILMDMGVSSSLIFIPMALFGTFCLIKENKWIEMATGMSALFFCHVITSIMVVFLAVAILIINWRSLIKKETLISLLKCVLITVSVTSIFWIPFIILYSSNQISMPEVWWTLGGTDINAFISFVFDNSVSTYVGPVSVRYITPVAFVGILVGIMCYKHIQRFDKQIFWIAIGSIFLTSSLFPWGMLNNTFIRNTFQFSWRIFIVTQVLLCYIFAVSVIKLCKNRRQTYIVTYLVTLLILCLQISGQVQVIQIFTNNQYDIHHIIKDDERLYTDYFPQNSLSISKNISNHLATMDNKKNTSVKLLDNGKFEFKLYKNTKSLKMPFLMYNNINYQVKVDGKNAKFNSDNHSQLTLGRMSKGNHTVQVVVHKSWYEYTSYVLSVLGVIILSFSWIRLLILKLKR